MRNRSPVPSNHLTTKLIIPTEGYSTITQITPVLSVLKKWLWTKGRKVSFWIKILRSYLAFFLKWENNIRWNHGYIKIFGYNKIWFANSGQVPHYFFHLGEKKIVKWVRYKIFDNDRLTGPKDKDEEKLYLHTYSSLWKQYIIVFFC